LEVSSNGSEKWRRWVHNIYHYVCSYLVKYKKQYVKIVKMGVCYSKDIQW
jgi:predicted secreted protein